MSLLQPRTWVGCTSLFGDEPQKKLTDRETHPVCLGSSNAALDPLGDPTVQVIPRDLGSNDWETQALSPSDEVQNEAVVVDVVA